MKFNCQNEELCQAHGTAGQGRCANFIPVQAAKEIRPRLVYRSYNAAVAEMKRRKRDDNYRASKRRHWLALAAIIGMMTLLFIGMLLAG